MALELISQQEGQGWGSDHGSGEARVSRDDVVQLAITYSDFYYLNLVVRHGGGCGGPGVGDHAFRARG
jgi:hypothetical protein